MQSFCKTKVAEHHLITLKHKIKVTYFCQEVVVSGTFLHCSFVARRRVFLVQN